MTEYSYDNDGSSTLIFLIAALAIYLIPTTYWRLSTYFEKPGDEALRHQNIEFLELCKKKKVKDVTEEKVTWSRSNIVYASAWALFFAVLIGAYAIQMQEVEIYNPYAILNLEQGASDKEIKSAYRKLSRTAHPDKRPDDPNANEEYMEIVKAYQALTDPDVKENWEKYGHPDGKRATEYGIALPAFIVSSEYKWPILGLYCVLFAMGMPLVVVQWWSQAARYTRERFLHETVGMFYHALRCDSDIKDVIDMLCAAVECRDRIPARPDDGQHVQDMIEKIVKTRPDLKPRFENTQYNADYCIKAKALMWCHLLRIPPPTDGLALDQAKVVLLANSLLQAMMKIAGMRQWLDLAVTLAHTNQFICQALDEKHHHGVYQVPHMSEGAVHKALVSKGIENLQSIAAMPMDKARETLTSMSKSQVNDIMLMAKNMPWVFPVCQVTVLAEDQVYINSMITLKIKIKRLNYEGIVEHFKNPNSEFAASEQLKNASNKKAGGLSKGDEDVNWDPSLTKKEKIFNEKGHSYPVYCPYFPQEREEAWWVMVGDSDVLANHHLLAEPKLIDDLVTEKETEILLPPVDRPGQYRYFVYILSDSYLGCDICAKAMFAAVAPPKVVEHEPSDTESEDDVGFAGQESDDSEEESDIESDS